MINFSVFLHYLKPQSGQVSFHGFHQYNLLAHYYSELYRPDTQNRVTDGAATTIIISEDYV